MYLEEDMVLRGDDVERRCREKMVREEGKKDGRSGGEGRYIYLWGINKITQITKITERVDLSRSLSSKQ